MSSCHCVFVGTSWFRNFFSWVFRGFQFFSRGCFVGLKCFFVGISLFQNFFSWIFCVFKIFPRAFSWVQFFFLMGISWASNFCSRILFGPYLFFSRAYNFVIQNFNFWLHEKLWQKTEMQISNQVLFSKSISAIDLLSIVTHSIIAYHISLVKVQTNYCNNNILILDVKQLNKIMKLYHFRNLKALWAGQG